MDHLESISRVKSQGSRLTKSGFGIFYGVQLQKVYTGNFSGTFQSVESKIYDRRKVLF